MHIQVLPALECFISDNITFSTIEVATIVVTLAFFSESFGLKRKPG